MTIGMTYSGRKRNGCFGADVLEKRTASYQPSAAVRDEVPITRKQRFVQLRGQRGTDEELILY